MATKNIKHACGHFQKRDLPNDPEEAKKKETFYASGECLDCWKERKDHEAQEQAADLGLPEMEGTEKQVKWAFRIRGFLVRQMLENGVDQSEVNRKLANYTQAAWWIENKDDLVSIIGEAA